MSKDLRIRKAVRAVIIDTTNRVLLVRFDFPDGARRWATPGGGINPGEEALTALRRELAEEVGLADPLIGPEVWTRTHIVKFFGGNWDGQSERFFLLRTGPFEPTPALSWAELNAEYMTAMRWWSRAELTASTESFAPSRLPALVADLVADGAPKAPIDVGV